MVSFLALLPRSLTTFLYAIAALLRLYGETNIIPFPSIPLTIIDWSLLAFCLGTASILAGLGLEWHAGNESRAQTKADRARAEDERVRAENERARTRQREARQDDLANEERNKADQERERAARRARIQNRFTILQIQHQLFPSSETRSTLVDFASFLGEYG